MTLTGRPAHAGLLPLPLVLVAVLALTFAFGGCGGSSGNDARPHIVATTPVLGDLTRQLVGDRAVIQVLMPNGADPHEFQASARDASDLLKADLVVENGLGLESGIQDAVASARDRGTATFTVTDHVRLRPLAHNGQSTEGGMDPHVWLDPTLMAAMVPDLAATVSAETGIDTAATAAATVRRLTRLDRDLQAIADGVPRAGRRIVTGHDSMGYFGARFGFDIIGAVIPSVSSEGAASAGDLADLRALMRREGVHVIGVEPSTPRDVARALADQVGAQVVEMPTNTIPDGGTYEDMMRQLMTRLVSALTA